MSFLLVPRISGNLTIEASALHPRLSKTKTSGLPWRFFVGSKKWLVSLPESAGLGPSQKRGMNDSVFFCRVLLDLCLPPVLRSHDS